MNRLFTLALSCAVAAGCSNGSDTGVDTTVTRGGTITIGEQKLTLVPSIQCSIYPNNQVNIAGHMAEDESLEVTIDYYPENDGPIGIVLGTDGRDGSWFSMRETTKFEIDGRQISGTTTFSEFRSGRGKSAQGSFTISC